MVARPRISTLFPYTTLFRSIVFHLQCRHLRGIKMRIHVPSIHYKLWGLAIWIGEFVRIIARVLIAVEMPDRQTVSRDRKSTRLNSSHVRTSYAVFCLKKKKN